MFLKKYAMVPINYKEDDSGKLIIRRVLISYKHKFINSLGENFYIDTKILDVDEYFLDPNSSHKYDFHDNNYTVIEATLPGEDHLIGVDRFYHDSFFIKAIEFKAFSDIKAIQKFQTRVK